MAIKNLTLKIQGQCYWWGQSLKSQLESNILSTHILWFHVHPPSYSYDRVFLHLTFKTQGQSHSSRSHSIGTISYWLLSLSFHVDRPSCSWDIAIWKIDLENPRSRSWVMSKLKVTTWVQHSVDAHPFHSMSIRHPIPELWLFQNLTLKMKGQGHGWGHSSKSIWFHVSQPSHSWDTAFSKFDLENLRSRSNNHDVTQLQVWAIP